MNKCRSSFPFAGMIILLILYGIVALLRPMIAPAEYDFALALQQLIPALQGAFLPRVPAIIAVFVISVMLYESAKLSKIQYPMVAPLLYLLFPGTFFIGTFADWCALNTAVIFLLIVAILIFRYGSGFWRHALTAVALPVIVLILLRQYRQGRIDLLTMCFCWHPILVLPFCRYLERRRAAGKLSDTVCNFVWITGSVAVILSALFLLPILALHFKFSIPAVFQFFRIAEPVYRPVFMLMVPLFWLIAARGCKQVRAQFLFIAIGFGFFGLVGISSMPAKFLPEDPVPLILANREALLKGRTLYYADARCASFVRYLMNVPVKTFDWKDADLVPSEMARQISGLPVDVSAVVFTDGREFLHILPATDMVWANNRYSVRYYHGGLK